MKISKTVVDLECQNQLDFNKEFDRITQSDPEFANIIQYYEDEIVKLAYKDPVRLTLTNKAGEDSVLLRSDPVTNLFHRFALNIYRIMSVQAELDEVEKECGTKEEE